MIQDVLAGVFVLHGFGARSEAVLRAAIARYRGGDFGGIDYMPPNAAGEAWLLLGTWVDCFAPEVQQCIASFAHELQQVAELDRAGVEIGPQGSFILDPSRAFPDSVRGELRALRAYRGGIAIRELGTNTQALIKRVLPELPAYQGVHMGAPHWLGRGVVQQGGRIHSVTPYIRIDFDDGHSIRIAAMAERRDFDPWLAALRAAILQMQGKN
ncbi:MAG TPA: hypothetical protein VF516_10435 [Kofleriaceae bacterium]